MLQPARLRIEKSVKGGVNLVLTYHVLGDHNRRARELNTTTCEVVSCEKCKGKFNPH
jgi:hypothetical protein